MSPRGVAPSAAEQLRRIELVTAADVAHLGEQRYVDELLARVCEVLNADAVTVLVLDRSSGQLVATVSHGLEEQVRQGWRVDLGRGFMGRVAARREPVIVGSVDPGHLHPVLRNAGIRALLGVPMLAGGRLVGALQLAAFGSRRFGGADVDVMRVVADRVALVVQAQNARTEQTAARTLQRSLLPGELPHLPGVELVGRYLTGDDVEVGGDWYDMFGLPSGRSGAVIGDVAGRGLHAAVVMGRMRSALRAYALEHADPAEVLSRLDRKMQHFEHGAMATVAYATFDPGFESMSISLAGHFPPVVALPDRPAELAAVPVDPPIGVRAELSRRTTTIEVAPGSLLCFFTDGLVETREAPIDEDLARLCACVTAGDPTEVSATVMSKLVTDDGETDDVAMLLLRRTSVE